MKRSRRVTLQQQQIRRQLGQSNAFTFFNLLTGPELFDPLEALLPAHRERRFPPTETLSMFLRQALSEDRSCQRAVNDAAVARVAGNLPRCSKLPQPEPLSRCLNVTSPTHCKCANSLSSATLFFPA